nr:S8 family peptidase [Leucothrix arctica]
MFGLEPTTTVTNRRHGTAMASLLIHGDRNNHEAALPRKIHTVPVLGENDEFPEHELIVDIVYRAVYSMLDGEEPSAPNVTIINLSLGNKYRPFHGQLSPWARLIDSLSYKYGILFLVSAGNITDSFPLAGFTTRIGFEDADDNEKINNTITAIDTVKAERKLLSPAETVNGLTIGAINKDWVPDLQRRSASININPYPNIEMINPSSALGPGFANSVKPELIFPGSRESLSVINSSGNEPIIVVPSGLPTRAAGLKVASPPTGGDEAFEGFTNGTSAATALASRTAHRIHDALESEYGVEFLNLPKKHKAVLLKALLVHPASWPEETASIIKSIIGPANGRQHVKQKDNIRRFLGYGTHDLDTAVACASDRATFWAVGELGTDQSVLVSVPIPVAIANKQQYHSISSTLAWMTPTNNGSQRYRSVRLKLIAPDNIQDLGVQPSKTQPDNNQIHRGTVATRRWEGEGSAIVGNQETLAFKVERQPDSGARVDDNAIFAVAITISMPGINEIYSQVRDIIRQQTQQRI